MAVNWRKPTPTSRYLSACPDLDYFRLADNLSGTLVIISKKPYRARVGIDLRRDFNEVAFRVTHHRFVVSISSYPRTSSYGHSGCAHGSYETVNCIA